MLREEGSHLIKELIEGRCPRQYHMVVSGQFDEARVSDEPGDPAPLLERRNAVTRAVKHQSGDPTRFARSVASTWAFISQSISAFSGLAAMRSDGSRDRPGVFARAAGRGFEYER